jgi:hypothetical protein
MVKPAPAVARFAADPTALTARQSHVSFCLFPPSNYVERGLVRIAVMPVDSGPAGGYPTPNGSCLHWVASIPAYSFFVHKILCARRSALVSDVPTADLFRVPCGCEYAAKSRDDSAFGG